MIDIDNFKPINDDMGHLVGDGVIRQTADIIRGHARESDILCRWGGEEFVILAPDCNAHDAQRLSEAIRNAVRDATFFPDHPEKTITISVGITEVRLGDTEDIMIGRADKAMYAAKANGRDCTQHM